MSEQHPLPWRAYKTWVFDANNNHVLHPDTNISNETAEAFVRAANSALDAAYERGAAEMRERAAKIGEQFEIQDEVSSKIRALPLSAKDGRA